jgi:hypothetical protein
VLGVRGSVGREGGRKATEGQGREVVGEKQRAVASSSQQKLWPRPCLTQNKALPHTHTHTHK